MKKLFLALIAAATVSSVSAQCGSILLYGNVSYNKVSTDANASFSFNPGVGYQLTKNWTAGITFNYEQDAIQNKTMEYGVFGRYTHDMGAVFYCYGQADIMMSNYTAASGTSGVNSSSFGVMLTPAIGIKVGKGYGIDFSMGGLGYSSVTPDGGTASNTLTFNFGQAVRVGLSKTFGCCTKSCKHKKGAKEGDNDDAPKKGKKARKDNDDE
jgi:hypothetical protein